MNKILDFYKKTSPYTDLGLYKEFAMKLPNDIKELAKLQSTKNANNTSNNNME